MQILPAGLLAPGSKLSPRLPIPAQPKQWLWCGQLAGHSGATAAESHRFPVSAAWAFLGLQPTPGGLFASFRTQEEMLRPVRQGVNVRAQRAAPSSRV